jgi:hypothetical protein
MKLVADSRGRLAAREIFRPGAAFDVAFQPDGTIRVVELTEKKHLPARLVRQGGRTVLASERTFTDSDVQKALEEFP